MKGHLQWVNHPKTDHCRYVKSPEGIPNIPTSQHHENFGSWSASNQQCLNGWTALRRSVNRPSTKPQLEISFWGIGWNKKEKSCGSRKNFTRWCLSDSPAEICRRYDVQFKYLLEQWPEVQSITACNDPFRYHKGMVPCRASEAIFWGEICKNENP